MRSHHFVKNYFLLPQKASISDLYVTQNTLDIVCLHIFLSSQRCMIVYVFVISYQLFLHSSVFKNESNSFFFNLNRSNSIANFYLINFLMCVFLMSENEFSGIIYSLFRGGQNIFLTIFSIKFVVKCATKIFKIG